MRIGPDAGVAVKHRGKLVLQRDDTSGANRCGVLVFMDESGAAWYVWVRTDGKLMISSTSGSDPGTDDTAGYVVGP